MPLTPRRICLTGQYYWGNDEKTTTSDSSIKQLSRKVKLTVKRDYSVAPKQWIDRVCSQMQAVYESGSSIASNEYRCKPQYSACSWGATGSVALDGVSSRFTELMGKEP